MTFHGYARARRLVAAVGNLQQGTPVTDAAFEHGYESLSGFNDAIHNLIGASPGAAGAATLLAVSPVETPLGPMLLGAAEGKLCLAEFTDRERLDTQLRRVRQRLRATLVPGREPPSTAPRSSWRNTSPVPADTSSFRCYRLERRCSARSGTRCCRSRTGRPGPTAGSLQRSTVRVRPDPWDARSAQTPSPSSYRATGSSAAAVPWPATAAACGANNASSLWSSIASVVGVS